MSQEAVERILGRMITDERFHSQTTDSLEAACLQEGYRLTQAELRMLSQLDPGRIKEFAGWIDPGLCRAGPGDAPDDKTLYS